MLVDVFNKLWKNEREKRKNRSFIREFWKYQDQVGEDNYATFVPAEDKTVRVPSARQNAIQVTRRLEMYNGCFIERDNSTKLLTELVALHTKADAQLDLCELEDKEFDRLMGRSSGEE